MPITLPEFIAKWQKAEHTERGSAQQHFIDLCDVLGQPRPADVDSGATFYAFEKKVSKSGGGQGFADVWFRDHFAWEYKGKGKDLDAAYQQLLQYRESLENPPLLVVCDLNRFQVHTNFTGTAKRVYAFTLADLASSKPLEGHKFNALDVLRSLFENPDRLKPQTTSAEVTEQAASEFARLAENLRQRGADPEQAAHFLMRLLFCLFAEDIGLLPPRLFSELVTRSRNDPARFNRLVRQLFAAMATGTEFYLDDISYFNGGLFTDDTAIDLDTADMAVLAAATALDWGSVEPAIFGTLFERSLDPTKRSQLGAHYTSREDILLIVEPVLMAPLRRRWAEVRDQCEALLTKRDAVNPRSRKTQEDLIIKLLLDFARDLGAMRVLDPACGSGNFLYVALRSLLDLWKELYLYPASRNIPLIVPETVRPQQLYGIEINVYARELASVVVWIGYLQWMHDNGIENRSKPILQPLNNIARMDAILAYDADDRPVEPAWPQADVIIGNPPFLGDKKMRRELGDKYVDDLRKLYGGRVPGGADLVTYWYERARTEIETRTASRAGLLATNSIRMIGNRPVLERIKQTGDIFMAWSDRPWILEGAAVRVSIVGFDDGTQQERALDGRAVTVINPDLTFGTDVTDATQLLENKEICFLGMAKAGPFDIDAAVANSMLNSPINPNGKPNSDVVRQRLGGQDVVRRPRDGWVIDFGVDTPEDEAALYELPFEYVKTHVKPVREASHSENKNVSWWLFARPRPNLRRALASLNKCIVTPEVSKYRLFIWMATTVVPDHKLHVIARDDDYFFGVLQSRLHEKWSLAQGARMGVGNDPSYSSSRTFETFPFPWPPGKEPAGDPKVEAIASAASDLVEKRDRWLNPDGATEVELKKRTLTNLYNARPAWLDMAHKRLDNTVFDAYGWPHTLTDVEILARLLALNLERSGSNQPEQWMGGASQD